MKETILRAARAEHIPAGESGLWYIKKLSTAKPYPVQRPANGYNKLGQRVVIEPGTYTYLHRWTNDTLMNGHGDCVMSDQLDELNTHLAFMLAAFGSVLITGLGLGCVIRGALANPKVQGVTVIERSDDVLKLVAGSFAGESRVEIIQADAIEWVKRTRRRFDCAWHDLWSDPDKEEPNLQVNHSKLMLHLCTRVKMQAAWQFPRAQKRLWKGKTGYLASA